MVEINPKTKQLIYKHTKSLAEEFHEGNATDLLKIIEDEELNLHIDDYEDHFDGMLVWDQPQFHIHLNETKGNLPTTKRGRFTLAHELGHYFIEPHRQGLKRGLLSPHPSNLSLIHSERIEKEADKFAASLLMPRKRLRDFTGGREFSFEIIKQISNEFQVSLTSAVIRFAEIGTHEILAVFSSENQVKWFCKSDDFPYLKFKFEVGGELPPTTVAGEFYRKSGSKYTGVELVEIEDWFYLREGAPEYQMHEQCFYSDIYEFTISLIWFE
ncbi:MAG TPA: ImmA/IrrE family metallo-endopeptidase [Balneolaceae bacterium]|nr:ImmA/IrrE family metallo-endopeptidase [Balneolaceae bacterium]